MFTGPTISAADAAPLLDAVYLPPAAHGDVYRAARRRPQAIGIIDGYFEHVPSIWHKEILWAMREGVHVFGSSSMGALRAAELAAFGMEGVGAIFEAFQRGELEDDDEVAVAHAPAARDYRPLSVALVNIRATLAAAEAGRIIRPATGAALLTLARGLFYPERSYPRLLDLAAAQGLDQAELAALRAWLPEGQIDQKRADALALLGHIRARLEAGLPPKQVRYHFEHSIYWEYVRQTAGTTEGDPDAAESGWLLNSLIDEARLDPQLYRQARQGVYTRMLAQALLGQQGQDIPDAAVNEAILAFRRTRGLHQPEAMQAWLAANELTPEAFARLIEGEAQVKAAMRWTALNITAQLVEQFRLDGVYGQLAERARHKQRVLEEAGLSNPDLESGTLTRAELLGWFFRDSPPADLPQYIEDAGFRDDSMFIRALLREFYYQRINGETQG
ncbi:MAG: hypothetical protein OHK0022_13590 [Roseiflexaceae bacterium]